MTWIIEKKETFKNLMTTMASTSPSLPSSSSSSSSSSFPLPSPSEALAHFSSLCDAFFQQQDAVSEHVILLVSTAQSDRLGEVSLRQNLTNSVAVEIGSSSADSEGLTPEYSHSPPAEKPLTEAERNQVFLELQKLGFHPAGGKLLIGNVGLLRQFLDIKDKRRRKYQSDMTARNFAVLKEDFIQRALAGEEGDQKGGQDLLDGTKVADDLEEFLDKYPGSLVAGPFLKGLATVLALKLSANLDDSVIEWVLFDSLFVIADEAYLRDTAGLLVHTLRCRPAEVSNEDATSLGLVEKKFDESEIRRRWKVPISKKAAQLILRELPSLASFAGKPAGEFLVNGERVADPKVLQRVLQQHRGSGGGDGHGGGISGMAWRCCAFL